jgi:large subunit ribosomal protein L44
MLSTRLLRKRLGCCRNPFILYQKCLFSTRKDSTLQHESKLIAFASRSGLRFNDYKLLLDAVTHISYPQKTEDTGRLQLLGKKILELYVTQYVMKKYPSLPPGVCHTITDAYIGQKSLAAVGKVFGVQFVMRWKKSSENLDNPPIAPPIISSWVVESLIGAIFQDQGADAAKQFINDRILSRSVDAEAHFDAWVKINQPRQMLSYLMQKLNKPNPVAR